MPRLCSLLYGVVPEGTNFFACEFIAQLCLPWGIDLWVKSDDDQH